MPITRRPQRLVPALLAASALFASGASSAQAQSPLPPEQPGSYYLGGYFTFKGALKGGTEIGGPLKVADFSSENATMTGALSLARTTATPTMNGWLFANLTMQFDADAPFSGTWANGPLAATAQVTVRFPKVNWLGFSIASGPNCKTKQPSTLTLASTKPTFDPRVGGQLTGTLPIGPLTGCGFLTDYASSLLSSTKHTVSMNLQPNFG